MENMIMYAVWVVALLVDFVPMPLVYKIAGIVLSIILLAAYIIIAKRNNRLSTITLIISLIVIGWDLAVVYGALSGR